MGPGTSYQILRYKDAETVLRDPETFSSSINGEHIGQFMGDLILAMDGDEHRKYRNLVAKAFRASQLERWDETLVRPMIDRLLDAIAPLGAPISSSRVTSRVSGPGDLRHRGRAARRRRAVRAVGRADQHRPAVARARAWPRRRRWSTTCARWSKRAAPNPTGDFLSDLVHAEVDGEQLSDSKIYGFLRLLLPAGGETTFRVMGNCLFALLTHPDALAQVYADRSLLPEVIEETLRWETSVTMVSRVATRDAEVAGCPIAAGSPVGVLTGSANHDEDALGRCRRMAARAGRCSTTSRSAPAPTSVSGCTSRGSSCGSGSTRSSTASRPSPRPGAGRRGGDRGLRVPRPAVAARVVHAELTLACVLAFSLWPTRAMRTHVGCPQASDAEVAPGGLEHAEVLTVSNARSWRIRPAVARSAARRARRS